MHRFLIICLCCLLACSTNVQPKPIQKASPDAPALKVLVARGKLLKHKMSLFVNKSQRRLEVRHADTLVKAYPIVLGQSPKGDKLREGDLKTPEGSFKIRAKYPHRKWKYFIWFDYPNKQSWRKHKAAKQKGTLKPSDTIGGEVGIHGTRTGKDYLIDKKQDWTWGCISMKNKHLSEIYPYVWVGMRLVIQP